VRGRKIQLWNDWNHPQLEPVHPSELRDAAQYGNLHLHDDVRLVIRASQETLRGEFLYQELHRARAIERNAEAHHTFHIQTRKCPTYWIEAFPTRPPWRRFVELEPDEVVRILGHSWPAWVADIPELEEVETWMTLARESKAKWEWFETDHGSLSVRIDLVESERTRLREEGSSLGRETLAKASQTSYASSTFIDETGTAYSAHEVGFAVSPGGTAPLPIHPAIAVAESQRVTPWLWLSDKRLHEEQRGELRRLLSSVINGSWSPQDSASLKWYMTQGISSGVTDQAYFDLDRRPVVMGPEWIRTPVEVTICYGLFSLAILDIHDMVQHQEPVTRCRDCGAMLEVRKGQHRNRRCFACRIEADRRRKRIWKRNVDAKSRR